MTFDEIQLKFKKRLKISLPLSLYFRHAATGSMGIFRPGVIVKRPSRHRPSSRRWADIARQSPIVFRETPL